MTTIERLRESEIEYLKKQLFAKSRSYWTKPEADLNTLLLKHYAQQGFKGICATKGRKDIRKMLLGNKPVPSRDQIALYHKEQEWRENHLDEAWQEQACESLIANINPSRRLQGQVIDDGRWSYESVR